MYLVYCDDYIASNVEAEIRPYVHIRNPVSKGQEAPTSNHQVKWGRIHQDKDLFILTYSDHVFNAMRVEIRKAKFQGAKVHNILNDGSDVIAEIDEDGHLTTWVDEIFDTWDNALTELLT